jgi:hypothetical protein
MSTSSREIEADLEETREHLAQTVDALGARLDPRPRWPQLAAAGLAVAAVVAVVVWRRR